MGSILSSEMQRPYRSSSALGVTTSEDPSYNALSTRLEIRCNDVSSPKEAIVQCIVRKASHLHGTCDGIQHRVLLSTPGYDNTFSIAFIPRMSDIRNLGPLNAVWNMRSRKFCLATCPSPAQDVAGRHTSTARVAFMVRHSKFKWYEM